MSTFFCLLALLISVPAYADDSNCENSLEPHNLSLFELHPEVFPKRTSAVSDQDLGELLSRHVEELGFVTAHQVLALRDKGIERVFQVVKLSEKEFADLATFMNRPMWESLRAEMHKLNLFFSMDIRSLNIGPKTIPSASLLNSSVRVLNLDSKLTTRLQNNGYLRVRDLVAASKTIFIFDSTMATLAKIEAALAERDLYFGMYLPDLEPIEQVLRRESEQSIDVLLLTLFDANVLRRAGYSSILDVIQSTNDVWFSMSSPMRQRINRALRDAGFPPVRLNQGR